MNSSARTRVLIAEGVSSLPCAISAMLSAEFEVVGNVDDNGFLLAEALRLEPDLILLDVDMALKDGFQAAKEIMRRLPGTKVVVLTLSTRGHHGSDAPKRSRDLSRTIRLAAVADDRAPAARRLQPPMRAMSKFGCSSPARLTHREREILALLASGRAMKVIAYELGICYRTVAFHKYRMMRRLGIRTNAGLTTYALQTGAIESAGDLMAKA